MFQPKWTRCYVANNAKTKGLNQIFRRLRNESEEKQFEYSNAFFFREMFEERLDVLFQKQFLQRTVLKLNYRKPLNSS